MFCRLLACSRKIVGAIVGANIEEVKRAAIKLKYEGRQVL